MAAAMMAGMSVAPVAELAVREERVSIPSRAARLASSAKPARMVCRHQQRRVGLSIVCRASQTLDTVSADAGADSIVPEVAGLPDADDTTGVEPKRKVSPLARGGTLSGDKAAGKDAGAAAKGQPAAAVSSLLVDGRFTDPRWVKGTWDFDQFKGADGKVDWDAVIDAEVIRRKVLEDNPIASTNDDPVIFESGMVPWWAWVRRFHLPEAEQLNGRAAMVGFVWALLWENVSGQSLASQFDSFGGKFFLVITLAGVLFIRQNNDLKNILDLANEWTFYDKQWQATWKTGDTVKDESSK